MDLKGEQVRFSDWLRRYGSAWESRDAGGVADLFTEDAEYYWTPFDIPKRGRDQIAAAWVDATSGQNDVKFTFAILSASEAMGIAKWHTRLSRTTMGRAAELEGILVAEFDDGGRCKIFREWWHSNEK